MHEIEKKSGRYIVWKHIGGNKLRQGSFATEAEAEARIEASRRLQELRYETN